MNSVRFETYIRVVAVWAAMLWALLGGSAHAQFVEPDVTVLYSLTSNEINDGFGFAAEAIGDLVGSEP